MDALKRCGLCGHALFDNSHGFDQNDAWMDGEKLIHSGHCTYCKDCQNVEPVDPYTPHGFYQDPLPREVGECDYTYADGSYCGMCVKAHEQRCDECGELVLEGDWPWCASRVNPDGHAKGRLLVRLGGGLSTKGWGRRS